MSETRTPRRRERQQPADDPGGAEHGKRRAKRKKQAGRRTTKIRREIVAQYPSEGKSLEAVMAVMPMGHQLEVKQEAIDQAQTEIDHPHGDAREECAEKKGNGNEMEVEDNESETEDKDRIGEDKDQDSKGGTRDGDSDETEDNNETESNDDDYESEEESLESSEDDEDTLVQQIDEELEGLQNETNEVERKERMTRREKQSKTRETIGNLVSPEKEDEIQEALEFVTPPQEKAPGMEVRLEKVVQREVGQAKEVSWGIEVNSGTESYEGFKGERYRASLGGVKDSLYEKEAGDQEDGRIIDRMDEGKGCEDTDEEESSVESSTMEDWVEGPNDAGEVSPWQKATRLKRTELRKETDEITDHKKETADEMMKERGRRTSDERSRYKIELKLKMLTTSHSKMSTRFKLMELLKAFQAEDEGVMLVHGEKKFQTESEIPAGEEFHTTFGVNKGKAGEEYLYASIETTKKLNELKYGNNGRTFPWLKKEGIFVQADRWKTERARTVGCILKIHPTKTWKPDMQVTIKQSLLNARHLGVGGFVREAWERKKRNEKTLVPEFALVHERKSFGMGEKRASTTVMNVEARVEDADYLKLLMTEAFQKGLIQGVFLQAGYHLSSTPKRLMSILKGQSEFLNDCRTVTIIGIKDKVMNSIIEIGEWTGTVKDYLLTSLHLKAVERTSRTEQLGKWILLTTKGELQKVRATVDKHLAKIHKIVMTESDQIGGISYPRRNNGLNTGEKQDEYIKNVEDKMGVSGDVESQEVVVVKEDSRREWKMKQATQEVEESPEKRQKTYAGAATQHRGSNRGPQRVKKQGQFPLPNWEQNREEKSYEEKVKEMNEKFDKKLREQEKITEGRLLREN